MRVCGEDRTVAAALRSPVHRGIGPAEEFIAVADEAILRNPCRITGAGQPSSPERPLLDRDTVQALINAMPAHLQTLTAIFWAHLRIGEAVALQRRDVDLTNGALRVERQHVEIGDGDRSRRPPRRPADEPGSACAARTSAYTI